MYVATCLLSLFYLKPYLWKFGIRSLFPFLVVTLWVIFMMPPPVERVKNQWDGTQHGVELRQQQLEDMIVDSRQWDDHREETEELMRKYEARLYMLQQARKDPLVKQISDNQVRLIRYFWHYWFVGCAFCSIVNCNFKDTCHDIFPRAYNTYWNLYKGFDQEEFWIISGGMTRRNVHASQSYSSLTLCKWNTCEPTSRKRTFSGSQEPSFCSLPCLPWRLFLFMKFPETFIWGLL